MFSAPRPSDPATPGVRIRFEGRQIEAREGDILAAVLLGAGEMVLRRSALSGAPRGPFCMMGLCFECLVEVDGRAGQQACLTRVRAGMEVRRDALSPEEAP